MPSHSRLIAGLLIAMCASACSYLLTGDCTAESTHWVTPREQTIAVGQAFTPTLWNGTCGNQKKWTVSTVWHMRVDDSTVIYLDTASGRVTGRSPGDAIVTPGDTLDASGLGVTVHVRNPTFSFSVR